MLLTESQLPKRLIANLGGFNIRHVEQLLAMAQSPAKLQKLALALELSVETLSDLLGRLRKDNPDLEIPAESGRRYPTGYVPAKK